MFEAIGLSAFDVNGMPRVDVGPGCTRIDLPGRDGMRLWIVDMVPGAAWPSVDQHDLFGEDVFVAEGEVIEGEDRYRAGTFMKFAPQSCHQPRTETGVRLFGINLLPRGT